MGAVNALVFDCIQEIFVYKEPNLCRYMSYVGAVNYRLSETDGAFITHAFATHANRTTMFQFPITVTSF